MPRRCSSTSASQRSPTTSPTATSAGGFQKVFEDAGGTLAQKLFSPLNAPDYGRYIAQTQARDRCRVPRVRRLQRLSLLQAVQRVRPRKTPIVGGMTAFDEVAVRNMGDYALGVALVVLVHRPERQPDQQALRRRVPRRTTATIRGSTLRHLSLRRSTRRRDQALKGKAEDKQAFIKALRAVRVDTLRGADRVRRIRQRGRQHRHPQGREEGRAAGQHADLHVSEREPVLDLRSEGIPEHPVWSRD